MSTDSAVEDAYGAGMIRDIHIGPYVHEGQTQYEPPETTLELSVIGEAALVQINRLNDAGEPAGVDGTIEVPAHSLLRALQAGIDDAASGQPST